MKIQVLSDLHIEFDEFTLEEADADMIVLAGDIHIKNKGVDWAINTIKNKPVLYVLGNHEFYGKAYPKLIHTLKEQAKGTNLHILENDLRTIGGINFLGCTLWTDFELFGNPRITGYECQQVMTDFKKIRVSPRYSKLRSADLAAIHRHSLKWLTDQLNMHQGEKNIIITHHAPSVCSLPQEYKKEISSAAYASHLEGFIEQYAPSFWIHGHLHHSSYYQIGSCQVICNPRGYPDERNPCFKPDLTIEVI
jgi:Icc-related predicted phosphoesterase